MIATRTGIFRTPDEFETALQQGSSVRLLVTGRGLFSAQLTHIAMPQLSLLSGEELRPRTAFVSMAPGSVLAILPVEQEPPQIWGGAVMQASEIMTLSPGGRVHARTTGICQWRTISVSFSTLMRYGLTPTALAPSFSPGVQRWRPTYAKIQSLVKLFNAAVVLTGVGPSMVIERREGQGLKRRLIAALINCLQTAPPEIAVTARHRHIATMIRMEDVIHGHSGRALHVPELCNRLGISQRALLALCKEQVGVGPSHYVRLSQMRRVRHALVRAHPDLSSVSGLAKSHGFNELGRFASAYRALFGELPSTTLRHGAATKQPFSSLWTTSDG